MNLIEAILKDTGNLVIPRDQIGAREALRFFGSILAAEATAQVDLSAFPPERRHAAAGKPRPLKARRPDIRVAQKVEDVRAGVGKFVEEISAAPYLKPMAEQPTGRSRLIKTSPKRRLEDMMREAAANTAKLQARGDDDAGEG
jgi:hypothetical protein